MPNIDIIPASVQFTDTNEIKVSPSVVLFEDLGNIVAGITSNLKMKDVPLNKEEGHKRCVMKLNHILILLK